MAKKKTRKEVLQEQEKTSVEQIKDEDVTNSVLIDVITRAAFQTEGMWRFSSRFYDDVVEEITEKLGAKRSPGISFKEQKDGFIVNVYIIVTLERNLIELCQEMQRNIMAAMKLMLQLDTKEVHVSIEGIHIEI